MTPSIDDARPARNRRAILIAGPTASGKSGLALRAGRAARRRRHQRRQHAGLPRAAHPHRAADARGARRARRTRSTASSAAPRPIRPGAMPPMRRRPSPRRARRAACPSSSAAPASTSRRCWRACRRCRPSTRTCAPTGAAQAAQRPAPELHALLAAARSGDGRAADADRPPAHRARAGGAGVHRPLAGRLAARARHAGAREARPCGCWCCRSAHAQVGRIEARFDAMMAAGALEEVRALLALGLSTSCRSCARWGWRRWRPICAGSMPLEEAVAAAKAETRQYAKRQLTWLRRNMIVVEDRSIRNKWKESRPQTCRLLILSR